MYYDMKNFANSEELKNEDLQSYKDLINDVGAGSWQNDEIQLYESIEDFAKYEILHGWYNLYDKVNADYNGAPNLYDYIDFEELGYDLIQKWDSTLYFLTSENKVLTTSYGW
ncbi:hypothetical protein [Staphylococcus chromogenes]|uniref:hypothetical protein n=1 Tax=Staphylococcus chromogenes TaxID=46126 RepID=UPI002887A387|nr:hypothetical protein [Staphylococcus chromogenes]MDT0700413.1 hypothetical protein [Staphylococcus chromogenes]